LKCHRDGIALFAIEEIEVGKWGKIHIITKTFSTPKVKRLHNKLIGRDDKKHMFDKSIDRESKQKK